MELQTCPHCSTRMIPKSDGTCPSCRHNINEELSPEQVEEMKERRAVSTSRRSLPTDRGPASLKQRKRNHLILLLVWTLVFGIVFGVVEGEWERPAFLLNWIVFSLLVVRWAYLDAAEHGIKLWSFFVPMMVICPGPLIVMPVYFIKSRGWIKGLTTCGIAIVVFPVLPSLLAATISLLKE